MQSPPSPSTPRSESPGDQAMQLEYGRAGKSRISREKLWGLAVHYQLSSHCVGCTQTATDGKQFEFECGLYRSAIPPPGLAHTTQASLILRCTYRMRWTSKLGNPESGAGCGKEPLLMLSPRRRPTSPPGDLWDWRQTT